MQVVVESMLIMIVGIVLGLAAGILSVAALADGIDLERLRRGHDAFGMSALLIPVLKYKGLSDVQQLELIVRAGCQYFSSLASGAHHTFDGNE